MQEDKINRNRNINVGLEPAYLILDKISDQLDSAGEDHQDLQSALENSLVLYNQAKEIFQEEDQPWLAAWVDLQKASLHGGLAQMANAMGRAVQAHTAMELIGEVLTVLPDLPPSMDLGAKLYMTMIIPLFQFRPFFEEPEQLQALDDLILGVSENIGEALALDLSLRAEANDLKFTAGVLEALADLEEDPKIKNEILETSKVLSHQAAGNLMISSPLDLSGYEMSQEEK